MNSFVPSPQPDDGGGRDRLFIRVAEEYGFVEAGALGTSTASLAATPDMPLPELLVRSGVLSQSARRGIERIIADRSEGQAGGARDSRVMADSSTVTHFQAPSGNSLSQTFVPGTVDGSAALRQFGQYELLEEIARGGMGVVYKARQPGLDRLVALKMIRSGELATDDDIRRFRAEAEAAARLDHPGIVPIYEVGEIGGRHFFSMALVKGRSLNDRIKAEGPLGPRAAAAMLKAVANAVQSAHDRGVIHRDVKPHNILLDEQGQPRVTDFGLARQVQRTSDLTMAGQILGTPSYMSPEQALGRTSSAGPSADVYSLGATLYCVLTGRPPFQASSVAETLRQVIDVEPVPLRQLNLEVPRDLETICLKCLRKEPERRYATAGALANDLERFLAGEPIDARPVGAWERAVKWVRRKPVAAALTLVSALALLALVAAGVSLSYQARLSQANLDLGSRNSALTTAEKKASDARDDAYRARDDAGRERDAANDARKQLAKHRYASDVAIAGRAWKEGEVDRMLELLDRHIPADGEDDLRGFEWHYLRQLERHDLWRDMVGYTRLSPDGRFLAITYEGMIRLVDPHTRETVRDLAGPAAFPSPFVFSGDGKRLIVPFRESEAVIYEVETGTEVSRLKKDDMNLAVAFLNHDGTRAALSGQGTDHSIRMWDVGTGQQIQRWEVKGYAFSAAFSRDGRFFAFPAGGSTIEVHDLTEGKLAATLAGAPYPPSELHFDPTGRWIFASSLDDTIACWNATTGLPEFVPMMSGGLIGSVLSFSADGKALLSGVSRDNSLRLWDVETGRLLSERRGHSARINHVALHPDRTLALSHSGDGTARLWRMQGPQDRREVAGAFQAASIPRYVPGKGKLTVAFIDEKRQLCLNDETSHRVLTGPQDQVYQYALSPDGTRVVTVHYNGTATFWNLASGERLHSLAEPNGHVLDAAWSSSGRLVATVCHDKTLRLWDPATGMEKHQFPAPSTNNGIVKIYFQPTTDTLVASQTFDGLMLIHPGDPPRVEQIPEPVKTYQLDFSPDGRRMATLGPGPQTITVWSFPELKPLQQLRGNPEFNTTFRFSPDGKRLAALSSERALRLWDLDSGQEVLTLPVSVASGLDFSPDGSRLCTGGTKALQIWDSRPDR